jgi:hypothetical protein
VISWESWSGSLSRWRIKRQYQFIARPGRIPPSHSLILEFPFKPISHRFLFGARRFPMFSYQLAVPILVLFMCFLISTVVYKKAANIETQGRNI